MLRMLRVVDSGYSRYLKKYRSKLAPYQYLLEHCPPPWGLCQLRASNVHLVQDRLRYFEMILSKVPSIVVPSQDYYKVSKVMLLLINPEHARPKKFVWAVKRLTSHLTASFFDFKYSEMYEEQLLIRFVEVFEACRFMKDHQRWACEFLLFLLQENEALQKTLHLCRNAYERHLKAEGRGRMEEGYEGELSELELYRANRQLRQDTRTYSYPTALLRFIDRKEMFTRYYNMRFRRQPKDPLVTKQDQTRNFTLDPSMQPELMKIYQGEQQFVENTKISRLDYLSATLFIVGRGHYSEKMLLKLHLFLREYSEKLGDCRQATKVTQLLQLMLICRIAEVLRAQKHVLSVKMAAEMQLQYRQYSEMFVGYFQKLQFGSLIQLLSHSSRLFPKYAPVKLHEAVEPAKLRQTYKRLFEEILDSNSNGQLYAQSLDLATVWQLIYQLIPTEDLQWIVAILEKYERLAYWTPAHTRLHQNREKNNILYLLLVKHGLKSDILAERLYTHIEKNAWTNNELPDKYPESQHSILNRLLQYYLYLQVVQTPSKEAKELEKIYLQTLLTVELFSASEQHQFQEKNSPQFIEKSSQFLEKSSQHKKHANLAFQSFGATNQVFLKTFQESQAKPQVGSYDQAGILYNMLRMLIKGYQIISRPDAQPQLASSSDLQGVFQQVYRRLKEKGVLQKLISYPNLFRQLCRVSILSQDTAIKAQILREISQISEYVKNGIQLGSKKQKAKIVILDQLFGGQPHSAGQCAKESTVYTYYSKSALMRQLQTYAQRLNLQLSSTKKMQPCQEQHLSQQQAVQPQAQAGTLLVTSYQIPRKSELDQELSSDRTENDRNVEQEVKEAVLKRIQKWLINHLCLSEIKQQDKQSLNTLASQILSLVKQKIRDSQLAKQQPQNATDAQIEQRLAEVAQKNDLSVMRSRANEVFIDQINTNKVNKITKKLYKTPLFPNKNKLLERRHSLLDFMLRAPQDIQDWNHDKKKRHTKGYKTKQYANQQQEKKWPTALQASKWQIAKSRNKELRRKLFSRKR